MQKDEEEDRKIIPEVNVATKTFIKYADRENERKISIVQVNSPERNTN